MAKYLLIAAILISLGTAGIGFMNHGKLVETQDTLQQTEAKLSTTQKSLTETSGKLKETAATLEATEKDKADLAASLTTTKSSLDEANNKITASDKTIADQEAQIKDLQTKLEAAGSNPNPTDPNAPVIDVAALKQQIDEKDAQITTLNERLQSTNDKLKVLEEEKKQRAQQIMKKGLEGRVLAVNPAWNFVVIGIGDKQGVVSNAEMLLKRGDQYLGKVRVTSVEPSTSIADILVNTLPSGVSVQPGDSVIYSGNE